MVIRLDNRDVLASQAVLYGAEDLALLLQTGGEGKLQLKPDGAEQEPGLPRDLDDLEGLQDVALFDVVEVLDADAALEALADRAYVVAETLQGGDVALVDHGSVAHHANAIVARDLTPGHVAARDGTHARNPEESAHLGSARLVLCGLGSEHAAHGGFYLLERLVDHVVGTDLHTFALGYLLRRVRRPDVEAEQDPVARRGEHDVRVGKRPDTAADYVDADLVAREPGQSLLERLDRSSDVSLDDEVEVLHSALAQEILERTARPALLRELLAPEGRLGLLGSVARDPLVVNYLEASTRLGYTREAKYLRRVARACVLDAATSVVEHRAHPAVGGASEYYVALVEGAAVQKQRRHGSAAGVALALDRVAAGGRVRICLEVLELGDDEYVLEELVYAFAGLGRHGDRDRLPTPRLGC